MKSLAPVFLAMATAIIAITTAIAGARGAFKGAVPLTLYLISYAVAILFFLTAAVLYYSHDEKPNVAPVRYDNSPRNTTKNLVGYAGLVVTNDGAPAYEVHLVSGKVGKSTPEFWNRIQRLERNGEGFIPINMQRAAGSSLLGGLFEEMKDNEVAALPITMRYKNDKGHRYKTTFRIVRDVSISSGLGIENVRHGRDWFGFLRFKK